MEQTFIMVAGLPNLGRHQWAKDYENAIIFSENEEYENIKRERIKLKKQSFFTNNVENIVENELKNESKNTKSIIFNSLNVKIRKELEAGKELVVVVCNGLNFRERGYIMSNIMDIKCVKNLIFFHRGINSYKSFNETQENKLSENEIDLLFSDFDMPDNKYIEGFNNVFLL
jgi:hypothetical protein